jgi:hypothetical protein
MTTALLVVWCLSIVKHLMVCWDAVTQKGGVSILPLIDVVLLLLSVACITLGARPFGMGATDAILASLAPSIVFYGAVGLRSLSSRS